jgi:hypothetical protein
MTESSQGTSPRIHSLERANLSVKIYQLFNLNRKQPGYKPPDHSQKKAQSSSRAPGFISGVAFFNSLKSKKIYQAPGFISGVAFFNSKSKI